MTTTLSPKLEADYRELFNEQLDRIPIQTSPDVPRLIGLLRSLLEGSFNSGASDASELADRVTSLQETRDQPELYARPEHREDFIKIFIEQVQRKIRELEHLSEEEQTRYLAEQKELRERAAADQALMQARQPPALDSEAHTVSEEEMLRQQQLMFAAEDPFFRIDQARQEPELELLPLDSRDDSEIVRRAVRRNPSAFQFASERLRDDPDFIVQMMGLNHRTAENPFPFIQFASERLRDNETFMRQFLDSSLIQFASERLRGDAIFMRDAVQNFRLDLLQFATEDLRDNPDFLRQFRTSAVLRFASPRLQDDRSFVQEMVAFGGFGFSHASQRLREDLELRRLASSAEIAAMLEGVD